MDSRVDDADVKVTSEVQSKWVDGAIININITNNSDETIEDWKLDFDFNANITNIWRATIVTQKDSTYSVKNCGYNSYIEPSQTETFGMQVSFSDETEWQEPSNFILYQHKKDKWYMDFDKEWNRSMIHADSALVEEACQKNKYSINIGLIDSGVDYMTNLNVVQQKNFVKEYKDINPLFSDLSGHGTAVAGLLASSDTYEENEYTFKNISKDSPEVFTKIKGVNPYVNIVSARVLNENNKTSISKLIKGIKWALKNNVKILNISCGVNEDNEELHNLIKQAYNDGVLIIAAAGNGKEVQYPAKYDEVMAVGAVKCNGEISESSATGSEIEVVAPGKDVTCYGPFGILTNYSGTSMAVPQVAALAAILWQQDITKSNQFIRDLIDSTANDLGDKNKYGYGLIDCEYALKSYMMLNATEQVNENPSTVINDEITSNECPIICSDEEVVEGFWTERGHNNTISVDLDLLRAAANWPDKDESKVKTAGKHPAFHGYYMLTLEKDLSPSKRKKINYVNAAVFMTRAAAYMYKHNKWLKKSKEIDEPLRELPSKLKKSVNAYFKKYAEEEGIKNNRKNKATFIYGMALHTVGDSFAHSAFAIKTSSIKKWYHTDIGDVEGLLKYWMLLNHDKHFVKTGKITFTRIPYADDVTYIKDRFISAQNVCRKIIETAYKNHTKMSKNVYKVVSCPSSKYSPADKTNCETICKCYGLRYFLQFLDTKNKKIKKKCKKIDEETLHAKFKGWVK